MINSGVLAAIHVASVRCDLCGAMQCNAMQFNAMHCIAPQGSQRTPATCIAATTPELIIGILNSVFKFFKFLKFLNNPVTLAR